MVASGKQFGGDARELESDLVLGKVGLVPGHEGNQFGQSALVEAGLLDRSLVH